MGTIDDGKKFLMTNYGRQDIAFERGQGCRLFDENGREFIDFLAGIAVVNLGHSHPAVTRALCDQAEKILHTSNLYYLKPQVELAKRLCEMSFADRAFFCNSGTEANEAALKLCRKWGSLYKDGASGIVTTLGSFHGRTMFSLSATGQDKFHAGFAPLVPGVKAVPYDDLKAMDEALTDQVCGVIVEPIQGEGGVRVPSPGYLPALRKLCDERRVLLVFDEVQTGIGRTGSFFAYEDLGAEPDVMTLAKALGNGFPMGAMLAREEAARAFTPGTHAATFGGNFLACRAALAVLDEFADGKLLAHVRETSDYFVGKLRELKAKHDCVEEVRGKGLLLGLALDRPGAKAVAHCMERGFIINCTADRVLRFVPPLVVTKDEIDRLIPVLDEALSAL